jgi:hypothetical protein
MLPVLVNLTRDPLCLYVCVLVELSQKERQSQGTPAKGCRHKTGKDDSQGGKRTE